MKIRMNRLVYLAPISGLSIHQILNRVGIKNHRNLTAVLNIEQARALLKIFTPQEVILMLAGKSKYLAKQALFGGV